MFDFPIKEFNEWAAIYIISVYSVIFLSFNKYLTISKNAELKRCIPNTRILLFIGFFIVTHCMHGDFFHMMERVQHDFSFIKNAYNVGEPIYVDIAKLVDRNYFLFRLIVWGGAFWLFIRTAIRLDIKPTIAALILFTIYIALFAYARVTLAMAIYFYGLSFLCVTYKNKILSFLVGIMIILLARNFHTSAFIMIAATLVIFIPQKKWIYILSILSIPVLIILLKTVFASMLLSESLDETVAHKMNSYTERDTSRGIAALIINMFNYATIYVPYLIIFQTLVKKNYWSKLTKDMIVYFKVSSGLILLATIFYFAGEMYFTFFYRVLFMAMIPITLLIAKLYQCDIIGLKQLKLFLLVGLIYHFLRYAYNLYLTLI